jgi:hypothetical protein
MKPPMIRLRDLERDVGDIPTFTLLKNKKIK